MNNDLLVPRRLSVSSIGRAISRGWALFLISRPVSVTYAMLFAVFGLLIFIGIEHASVAPMILPMAGGFMLIGPALLCGFFSLADRMARRETPRFSDISTGFRRATREIFALSLVCMLLFMIWMTDAATLYGFMVGRAPASLLSFSLPADNVWSFIAWSSLMGAALAFVIFTVSAFSVPLLYYRRVGLVPAVVLSVRAVFGNFVPCVLWALLLGAATIGSILMLPLFPIVFPVLAFASHALYRELFPEVAV